MEPTMSFCSFSKELNENSSLQVENRFITKYLPEADGLAVKVYLYGLYLCRQTESEFSIRSMAEVLKTDEKNIRDAFLFWQEYDLVQILSHEPFSVEFLPVHTAVGKPKKIRYEQYADFNKELQRQMQKVGKFIGYNDTKKYMQFLEENDVQPHALLLIVDYCIRKQGEAVSHAYVFNKAKKMISSGFHTYEQMEKELSSYHQNEGELKNIFSALAIYRKVDETDYATFNRWTQKQGFEKECVLFMAKRIKKGTMETLGYALEELSEKGKFTKADAEEYFAVRDVLAGLTFKIARKLGVKVGNPAPFIEEYVEKWYNYGLEESSLLDVASYAMRSGKTDFSGMDEIVEEMFHKGLVSNESAREYLQVKNAELKLFTKIQSLCGNIKKSHVNLAMIPTWREWNFSDEMILEAARRSADSASPIPYMNKILSDWKRENIFHKQDIPEKIALPKASAYIQDQVNAMNEKADRERYYASLREKAISIADKYLKKAKSNPAFKEISERLAKMEISLAKAEMFAPESLASLQEEKQALRAQKNALLADMGMTESMLSPQFACKKCSDTGFLKNGKACDCYEKNLRKSV